MKKIVAVFGPAGCAEGDPLYNSARTLGRLLAEANFTVLTGGYGGVMEAAVRGAREANGTSIGVTAEVFFARGQEASLYLTREIRVKSANDRTMELLDLADAYIAIGNSTGTLVEVALAWDYMIKCFLPEKPLLLLDEAWKQFLGYISKESQFANSVHLVHYVKSEQEAVTMLQTHFGISAQLPSLDVINV